MKFEDAQKLADAVDGLAIDMLFKLFDALDARDSRPGRAFNRMCTEFRNATGVELTPEQCRAIIRLLTGSDGPAHAG